MVVPQLRRRRNSHGKRSRSRERGGPSSSRSPTGHFRDLLHTPDLSSLATEKDDNEELALVPVKSISKLAKQKVEGAKVKGTKRRAGLLFFLGGLFGLVMAGFFAKQNDLIDFPGLEDLNLSVEGWMDVLPQGFLQDAKELKVNSTTFCMPCDSGKLTDYSVVNVKHCHTIPSRLALKRPQKA